MPLWAEIDLVMISNAMLFNPKTLRSLNQFTRCKLCLPLDLEKSMPKKLYADILASTFSYFLLDPRFKTVAEILNAEGHRTANGALFTGQSVSRILHDISHVNEGRVSQELWDQCQGILAAKKRGGGARRRVAHLCSGLLKCGCGQSMYVPTNSKKYVCSKCRNKIAKDDLEAVVLENLKDQNSPEIVKAISIWSSLSLPEKREIIESTVEEIIAEDKKVSIFLFAFG